MIQASLVPDPRRTGALAGSLLGLALGDALGFVVEAAPPEVAQDYVSGWLRAGRAGERSHPAFPFGQYSDDTQLARELLLSVRDAGGWNPAAFAARVAALVRAGEDVGAGPGTRSAAQRLLLGCPWHLAGVPPPYAGNGSAMRSGPLGLLFGEAERCRCCVSEQSRVTHHDARCAAGALAIAGAVAAAAESTTVDPVAFVQRAAAWADSADRRVADVVRGVVEWVELEPAAASRRLQAAGLDPTGQAPWRGISTFVIPSVAWSLYAFLRSPDDYWEAVCTAIEVGGDTDTMAAMTGAIAGARAGLAGLPAHLLDRLTDRGRWGAGALAGLARDCAGLS